MRRNYFMGIAAALAMAAWTPRALADGDDESSGRDRDDERILSIDHYVNHVSTIPATAGHHVQLFVRERVRGGVEDLGRDTEANGSVVLFIHGGTYPSVPDYDLDFKNYNFMAYLARAGFADSTSTAWTSRATAGRRGRSPWATRATSAPPSSHSSAHIRSPRAPSLAPRAIHLCSPTANRIGTR